MITVPFYNMIVVPGVTFYFQKDYFQEVVGREAEDSEELIFLMLKENKKREDITKDDFYPIGVSGVVERIDKEVNVGIRTLGRVNILNVEITENDFKVTAEERRCGRYG